MEKINGWSSLFWIIFKKNIISVYLINYSRYGCGPFLKVCMWLLYLPTSLKFEESLLVCGRTSNNSGRQKLSCVIPSNHHKKRNFFWFPNSKEITVSVQERWRCSILALVFSRVMEYIAVYWCMYEEVSMKWPKKISVRERNVFFLFSTVQMGSAALSWKMVFSFSFYCYCWCNCNCYESSSPWFNNFWQSTTIFS